jgi:hypothetical protein
LGAETAFALLNASVLPWWGAWLLVPRAGISRALASHAAIFVLLAGLYATLIVTAVASGDLSLDVGDFDGLRAGLSTPTGFLAGWVHFLCFDLFIGAWIVRESARLDLEPRAYLLFALMLGPIGLGAFLLRRALHLKSFGRVGEFDVA